MLKGMVCQVLEKAAKGLRAMQGTAGKKLLKLGLLYDSFTHYEHLRERQGCRHCNTNVTHFASLCEVAIYAG